MSIHRFVHPGQSQLIGRDHRDYKSLDPATVAVPIESFDNTPRQHAHDGSAEEAKKTFHDLRGVFTEEQMKKETERCLGCGAVVLNEDQCIGCGICTTKCEFDAIHLSRELPDCSNMVRSEDKFKAILPYMLKREMKIRFGKKEK